LRPQGLGALLLASNKTLLNSIVSRKVLERIEKAVALKLRVRDLYFEVHPKSVKIDML
jgi:hypothetical protein